jgi:mannose-1-phosphate guanylyltransferase
MNDSYIKSLKNNSTMNNSYINANVTLEFKDVNDSIPEYEEEVFVMFHYSDNKPQMGYGYLKSTDKQGHHWHVYNHTNHTKVISWAEKPKL